MTQPTNFQNLLENKEINQVLREQAVITAYRGSIAHNLYVPPEDENGTDDIDLINIHIPARDYYFPVNKNDLPKPTREWSINQYDIVGYELSKFVYMLTQCNPNTLTVLWLRPEHYIYVSYWGSQLISMRKMFLSRHNVYNAFNGYAHQQLKGMIKGGTDAQYMGAKRRNLVEKYGYDTRHASHLIRLLKMGVELLETGEMQVYREYDRTELLNIKNGLYTLDYIQEWADELFNKAYYAYDNSPVQNDPDLEQIQEWVSDAIHGILSSRELGKRNGSSFGRSIMENYAKNVQ